MNYYSWTWNLIDDIILSSPDSSVFTNCPKLRSAFQEAFRTLSSQVTLHGGFASVTSMHGFSRDGTKAGFWSERTCALRGGELIAGRPAECGMHHSWGATYPTLFDRFVRKTMTDEANNCFSLNSHQKGRKTEMIWWWRGLKRIDVGSLLICTYLFAPSFAQAI